MTEKEFDEIPFPEYEADPEVIALLYAAAWKQVIAQIFRLTRLPQTSTNSLLLELQGSILRQLTVVFDDLRKELGVEVGNLIEDAYVEGIGYTRYSFGKYESLTEAMQGVEFSLYNKRRLHKQITDTQKDLLKVTKNTEDNVKKLVRTSVATAMRSTGGRTIKRKNMIYNVQEELTKKRLAEGLKEAEVAIVDKAGNRWNTKTYINMAVKTKLSTVYMDGIRDEALQDGADLAIISTKPDTTDACKNFEGMIISLNGVTPGYPSYTTLRKSKLVFHPNCGHFCRPVQSEKFIPKPYFSKHAEQMKKWEKYQQNETIQKRLRQPVK